MLSRRQAVATSSSQASFRRARPGAAKIRRDERQTHPEVHAAVDLVRLVRARGDRRAHLVAVLEHRLSHRGKRQSGLGVGRDVTADSGMQRKSG